MPPEDSADAGRRPGEERQRVSLLVYHPRGVQAAPLEEGERVVVGRSPPADVVVDDPTLSQQHAAFELVDGQVWVEDLGSTNGTLIGGRRVAAAATLGPGEQVALGAITVCHHVLGPTDRRLLSLGSHDRFLADLEDELVRARTFGRKVGLIMVRPARRGPSSVGGWCPRLQQRLRAFDRIALYSSDEVEIATPETGREALAALAAALDAEPQEAPLVAGVALYPDSAPSAELLIQITRQALLRATSDAPLQLGTTGGGTSAGAAISALTTSEHAASDVPVVASAAMSAVYATVALVAPSSLPVLICGETGSGKEVVARAIHEASGRRERPLLCINCGAIPGQLIESALFGHERGAFSGADQRTKGVFEEADGGTVLLDEIGELSAQAQTALLRVLENKRISRVGSAREIPVDVRVLAATHRVLEEMCGAGTFREDLLYRLNAMTLRVPPLRERLEELSPLVRQFMRQANSANGCQVTALDPEALVLLRRYPWPGNVRELRNVIERAVVLQREGVIAANHLPERLRTYSGAPRDSRDAAPPSAVLPQLAPPVPLPLPHREPPSQETRGPAGAAALSLKEQLRTFEALLLVDALERCGWNKAHAARRLGMPLRTLFHKIASYGISDDGAALRPLREELARIQDPCAATGSPELRPNLQACEARLLKQAMLAAGGDTSQAARELQISPHTLAARLRALRLA